MAMRSVSETVAVASAAVLSVLVIVIITGNCIVCMIILKYRDMRYVINASFKFYVTAFILRLYCHSTNWILV